MDACDNSLCFLTHDQVICITIILKQNNLPIRDRNRFLPHRSRPQRARKTHHISRRIHYRRSRPRHMHHRVLDLELTSQDPITILTKVRLGEAFGAERHMKTADFEDRRTGQSRSMLYLGANRGY